LEDGGEARGHRVADSGCVLDRPPLDGLSSGSVRPPSGRVERAEEQARALIAHLFRPVVASPADLRDHRRVRRLLLSSSVQRLLGYSLPPVARRDDDPTLSPRELELLRFCVEDRGFFARSIEPIEVEFDPVECEMLESAQAWLRRLVTEREITVEASPSSNLLIADYGSLREHPVFRLLPLQSDRTQSPVLVSLNSDDPIVFATRLSDEYAYIYSALRSRDVSSPEAIEWLERVRENALRSRFTLPASSHEDALRWLLERLRHGETETTDRLERQWARGERPWLAPAR
jgi:hypothetical protein